jgi:hypothetical protein
VSPPSPVETTLTRRRTLRVLGTLMMAAVPAVAARSQTTSGGRGGPPVQGAEEDIPLVARFDRNADKMLDYAERTAARE